MVSPDFETHEVANQIPPRLGANLYASDPVLAALVEDLPQPVVEGLTAHGAQWGSAEMADLARLANTVLPHLRSHDASGRRVDLVEFHPAWHALMRRGVGAGLHASIWDAVGEESNVRAVARAAGLEALAPASLVAATDFAHLPLSDAVRHRVLPVHVDGMRYVVLEDPFDLAVRSWCVAHRAASRMRAAMTMPGVVMRTLEDAERHEHDRGDHQDGKKGGFLGGHVPKLFRLCAGTIR